MAVWMAGVTAAVGQTTTFGTYTSPAATPDTFSVLIPAGSGSVDFSATFNANVTFTPVVNNPVAGTETFTITYSAVTLTLSSLNGYLATDPLTLSLGPISRNVSVSYPYSQATFNLAAAYGSTSGLFDTVFTSDTTDTMIVTWAFLGGPTVSGGKGATINADSETLDGQFTFVGAVPETAEFAAPAILILSGLIAWRGNRRRKAAGCGA
jgi:hypothetical protein